MDRTAMRLSKLTVVFLLHFLTSSIQAAGETLYGLNGDVVILTPGSFSGELNRILWKHGDDKAAEWERGELDYYRQFKGHTDLDTEKGLLKITKLEPSFDGVYSAEVNGIKTTKVSKLKVLRPVTKPSIDSKCTESTCMLSCKGEKTVKGQYAWREGEGEWEKSDGTLEVVKTPEVAGKAYICNYSNPVSSALSDPVVLFPGETPVGLIVVGLLLGILIILGLGVAFRFRRKFRNYSLGSAAGNQHEVAAGNQDGANDGQGYSIGKFAGNQDAAGNQDGANDATQGETLDNTIDEGVTLNEIKSSEELGVFHKNILPSINVDI